MSVDSSETLCSVRVSAKSDYALRALIEMSAREDGRAVSAEELGGAMTEKLAELFDEKAPAPRRKPVRRLHA